MIKIHENYSLRKNTTFGNDIAARWFAEPSDIDELEFVLEFSEKKNLPVLVIGEGSNLLFLNDYEGLVIRPAYAGLEVIEQSGNEILVRVGSGENWDSFVERCVGKEWYGPENLSLIPGAVGAAPVQNVGAYGVEAADIIDQVEVYDRTIQKQVVFTSEDCMFGYRDSIFKHVEAGRHVVLNVIFRLSLTSSLKLDYGNVREVYSGKSEGGLKALRESIIEIRSGKLPDPSEYGNAGSFFKNPVISEFQYHEIKKTWENIPKYPFGDGTVKIPAAWLIEKSGMKGIRKGAVGTWPSQPLVIVNYGDASGKDLYDFSESIQQAVRDKFGIELDREVRIIS